jgi:multicomponent Na+:H+ antiporter subunit D
MNSIVVIPILIPLFGAVAAFLMPPPARRPAALTTAMATMASSLWLSVEVWQSGALRHAVGGWDAPLGIQLYADGLSVLMILLMGVSGLFITIYTSEYLNLDASRRAVWTGFWPIWLFLWGAMNALFVASDLFNIYVALEVAGLGAVALAALAGTRDAMIASMRYLLAAMLGSLSYLLGVGLLYAAHGQLDIFELGRRVEPGLETASACALMMVGLFLKTALFPLHFWLPPAHSSAPAPVSAVLSALVVKGSFFLALRLWFEVFDAVATAAAGQCIGALGAMAILWGSYQALRQRRLKLLVAHSTVGQIGYLFLLFPLTTVAAERTEALWIITALGGGIYQAISHGLAKAAMFLASGIILHAVGSDKLTSMRDIASQLPTTTFALALAGVSLMGLPPSGGFVAKWMLLKAILDSGQWWWAPVVLIGGLLTAGYVFLMLRYTFVASEEPIRLRPVPPVMELCALFLALASVVAGFRLEEPLALLRIGNPMRVTVSPAL